MDDLCPDVMLNEYDKEEWWDVCSAAAPSLTRDTFELVWARFLELKEKKKIQ